MTRKPPLLGLTLLHFALAISTSLNALASKWDSIPQEQLQSESCPTDAQAKAENLFIHETIENDSRGFAQRIKLYSTDEATIKSLMTIEYSNGEKIWNLRARVVKPDGSSKEYDRKDFTENLAVKTRWGRINKLTAALGQLEAGDVIEMEWQRSLGTQGGRVLWGMVQGQIPTREYTVHLKSSNADCNYQLFNIQGEMSTKEGGIKLICRNIPALPEEPNGPPTMDQGGWYGLFFKDSWQRQYDNQDLYILISNYWHEDFKVDTKPNRKIKELATAQCASAKTDEDKLNSLYDWCQANLSSLTYFKNSETEKLRTKREKSDNWSVGDTLNNKGGYATDINRAFGALARGLGFETRLAFLASRRFTLNINHRNGYYFMDDTAVAVKIGEAWKLYAPGDYHTPAGLTHPYNENAPYQLCEEDKKVILTAAPAPAAASPISRTARMNLDEDGNLEGDMELVFGGNCGADRKYEWHSNSQEEVNEAFRKELLEQLPNAEIGDLDWTNLYGTGMPLSVKFHVRIPAYAELLGERIAFATNPFTKANKALFTAEERRTPIFFDHARVEDDDIEITFPEGYTLEVSSPPANVTDSNGILSSNYRVGYKGKTRTLNYKRHFGLCENGNTAYSIAAYPIIRRLSELIQKSDTHTFMCKPRPLATK